MVTSATPADPDYRSLWSAVDTVGTSVSPDGTITVDLPAAAFGTQLSEKDAQMALQQMVYTVSAAAVTAGLLDASTAKVLDGDERFVLTSQPTRNVRGFGDVRPVSISQGRGPLLEEEVE